MPRLNIRRDQTGAAVQPVPQGQPSRVRVARVSFPNALTGIVSEHQDIIWRTAQGVTGLHRSTRVRNMPAGAIGYIHSINNVCIAVSRLDPRTGTIELVGGVGHVNSGMHIF
ncbi:hypothetical protein [Massilia pseudoviolaceinigra]|uniref:hypothetical protein n=1 Tax=Massilia pseudoviolaceinigra TaxID=3057165 RepID=UPI002796C9B5|nr:hypothetical protein [Massilia sp. CCM 9206]MDQ1923571.1 hypothetical protein [Massilia sp. CCM 9206]